MKSVMNATVVGSFSVNEHDDEDITDRENNDDRDSKNHSEAAVSRIQNMFRWTG